MPMTRRAFLASSAATLGAGLGHGRVHAQAPASPAAVAARFQDLRRGVGIFTVRGGTIGYLVNDAGARCRRGTTGRATPAAMP
jgi:hypothetical protein